MRQCDTCGRELSEVHPFNVCPRCLFGEALGGEAATGTGAAGVTPEVSRPAAAPRLVARRDFFDKYEILERFAAGGQGSVWKVWDVELRRTVAMKRLTDEALASRPAWYRFLAEAQIAGQLDHPGILPIYDVGLDPDGRPFYTTQLLPGATLGDVWKRVHDSAQSEWTLPRALELLVRVCEIMAHAHDRGVVHRDLKPANVLVGPHGDVRVIDWGSAFVLPGNTGGIEESFVPLNRTVIQTDRGEAVWGEPGSPLATAQSGQPVTLLFVPPEVLAGRSEDLGPQTDVYAVGMLLYELLWRRLPYCRTDGSFPDREELKELILRGPPQPIRGPARRCSRDLSAICRKAMAHSRTDRYLSMQAMAADIRAALEIRPVTARRPGPLLVLQKWALRNIAYVGLSFVFLLALCGAFAVAQGLKAERNVALQLTALSSADLAARSGQWREALKHWEEARAAGYADAVQLALRQAEAWTVLNEPDRGGDQLRRLARRPDLGPLRGAVLLRLGEHELFSARTHDSGVQRVRQALGAQLTAADRSFAEGLLAPSTPVALEHFRQALQLDPYHHGAHRHSLGLEFLLGRHQEMETHARIFKVLYPDDPSPDFLNATALALEGRLAEAEAQLASLKENTTSEMMRRLEGGLRALASAATSLNIEDLIQGRALEPAHFDLFASDPVLPLPGNLSNPGDSGNAIRLPHLPCIRQGVLEGADALQRLMLPFLGDPDEAVEAIKASWQRHPEAWLPLMAGLFLEQRHPREGPKSRPLLQRQADLFELAAESPSMMPKAARVARFLAAKSFFELATEPADDPSASREACLLHVRRAASGGDLSAAEFGAYFDLAHALDDHQLARDIWDGWKEQAADDPSLPRRRIEVETAAGAYATALKHVDQLLKQNPDPWLIEQREFLLDRINKLLESLKPKNTTPP